MSLAIESKYIRLLSHRLRNFKQKKDYLWNFSCPICGDSKKNLLKARGYVYANLTIYFIGVITVVLALVSVISSNSLMQKYTSHLYLNAISQVSLDTLTLKNPSLIHQITKVWKSKETRF